MESSDKSSNIQSKINIQRYIFWGGIFLFILKVFAFYLTNSVGILSDAMESTVNIITGLITLKALQFAAKPRDVDHPYGHGKIELLTSSIEGILIGIAGILIIMEAVKRLGAPPAVTKLDLGIVIMCVTAIINYMMGAYSKKMGKKLNSIGLVSGGQHLISDTYTTLALVGGLMIFYFTGSAWVDSGLAIIFGFIILYTSYEVLKTTVNGLMDEADSAALNRLVTCLRDKRSYDWVNIHKLTYLKFGHVSHVDFHLTLPWYYNIKKAAIQISNLKAIIRENLPEEEVDISVQSEPCTNAMCYQCQLECKERKEAFTTLPQWTTEQLTGKNIYIPNSKH